MISGTLQCVLEMLCKIAEFLVVVCTKPGRALYIFWGWYNNFYLEFYYFYEQIMESVDNTKGSR